MESLEVLWAAIEVEPRPFFVNWRLLSEMKIKFRLHVLSRIEMF